MGEARTPPSCPCGGAPVTPHWPQVWAGTLSFQWNSCTLEAVTHALGSRSVSWSLILPLIKEGLMRLVCSPGWDAFHTGTHLYPPFFLVDRGGRRHLCLAPAATAALSDVQEGPGSVSGND